MRSIIEFSLKLQQNRDFPIVSMLHCKYGEDPEEFSPERLAGGPKVLRLAFGDPACCMRGSRKTRLAV
jgi:hypothetical protein